MSCPFLKDFREVDSGAHVRLDHRQSALKRCIDEGASPADTNVENGYGEGVALSTLDTDEVYMNLRVKSVARQHLSTVSNPRNELPVHALSPKPRLGSASNTVLPSFDASLASTCASTR